MNNATIANPSAVSAMPRSVFKHSVPGFASMNYGRVYPVFMKYQEARSKMALDVNTLIRGATPIAPTMGNAKMELHAFSVPWRIIWNYTKQFFGENDTSAWTQSTLYKKPQIELRVGKIYICNDPDNQTWDPNATVYVSGTPTGTVVNAQPSGNYDMVYIGKFFGTYLGATGFVGAFVDISTSDCYGVNKLADYLGLHPIPKDSPDELKALYDTQVSKGDELTFKVDALPFRAFFSVINYYYRDQNYQAPYLYSKDNGDLHLSIYENSGTVSPAGSLPMPYDFMYYRAIGTSSGLTGTKTEGSAFCPPASRMKDPFSTITPEPLKGDQYDLLSVAGLAPVVPSGTTMNKGDALILGGTDKATSQYLGAFGNWNGLGSGSSEQVFVQTGGTSAAERYEVNSSNLFADLSQTSKITLQKFREFVLLNQWNEKAVKGTRYAEILAEFYGVPVNPALLDEPRFLGGVSIPIASWQVTQNAPNSDGSGVGDLGAFTHTKDQSGLFTFSFDEPSILLVCAVARVEHMFAQQTDPHWFRQDRYDEHYAMFDGLGYQPLDKRIPYLPFGVIKDNGGLTGENETLGFQEAFWEERYQLGNSAGVMNASNPYALRYFLYNELPAERPTGSPEYLSAFRDAEIVDNTLQLGENASLYAQQLIVNFSWNYIEAKQIKKSGRDPGLTRI